MFFVYLLLCSDQTLYCGYTVDLDKRLLAHQSGKGAKYTRARLPVRMVYSEVHPNKSSAMSREYAIKRLSRCEKLALCDSAPIPDDKSPAESLSRG